MEHFYFYLNLLFFGVSSNRSKMVVVGKYDGGTNELMKQDIAFIFRKDIKMAVVEFVFHS